MVGRASFAKRLGKMAPRQRTDELQDGRDLHVVPVKDLRKHELRRGCWCAPRLTDVEGTVVVTHQSMDGRELVEAHGLQ